MVSEEYNARKRKSVSESEARKRESGKVKCQVWCKPEQKPIIKEAERRLAKDDVFEAAFKSVFGVDE